MVRFLFNLSVIILSILILLSCVHAQLIGGQPAQTGPTCGPLTNYACSNNGTNNPGFVSPTSIFPANSLQNATAFDNTLNPSPTDCITKLTDSNSRPGGLSTGNFTSSAGDNDRMISINTTYVGINYNGNIYIYHLNTSGNCAQVVNTGQPIINKSKPFSFSNVTDNVFYYMVSFSQIWKATITSDTTVTTSLVFDFAAPGNCPGIPSNFTLKSGSIFSLKSDDTRFTLNLSELGGQATSNWLFSYDSTVPGCSVTNFNTLNYWSFTSCAVGSCSSSTPPTGQLSTAAGSCAGSNGATGHGIHDSQTSFDGSYAYVTLTPPWTLGSCAGQTVPATQFTILQIGTANNIWAGSNTATFSLGGHVSAGYTHTNGWLSGTGLGLNTRLNSTPTIFTNYATWPVSYGEIHASWPHLCTGSWSDNCPVIDTSDSTLGTATGCVGNYTSVIYCPPYLNNVVFASFPNGTNIPFTIFTHTGTCGTPGQAYSKCQKFGVVNTNNTTVTWVSGDKFPTNFNSSITINGVIYTISSVNINNTILTLSTSAGTQSNVSYSGTVSDSTFAGQFTIGNASPDGNWFFWASSQYCNQGFDNLGNCAEDVYVVHTK